MATEGPICPTEYDFMGFWQVGLDMTLLQTCRVEAMRYQNARTTNSPNDDRLQNAQPEG